MMTGWFIYGDFKLSISINQTTRQSLLAYQSRSKSPPLHQVVQRRTLRRASLWRGCREPMIRTWWILKCCAVNIGSSTWKCSQCANCFNHHLESMKLSAKQLFLLCGWFLHGKFTRPCTVSCQNQWTHHTQRLLGVWLEMIPCWVNHGLVMVGIFLAFRFYRQWTNPAETKGFLGIVPYTSRPPVARSKVVGVPVAWLGFQHRCCRLCSKCPFQYRVFLIAVIGRATIFLEARKKNARWWNSHGNPEIVPRPSWKVCDKWFRCWE